MGVFSFISRMKAIIVEGHRFFLHLLRLRESISFVAAERCFPLAPVRVLSVEERNTYTFTSSLYNVNVGRTTRESSSM